MDTKKTVSAKNILIRRLMSTGYSKKQALNIYDIFVDVLTTELLSGQKIRLRDFGTFCLKYHNGHRSVGLGDAIDGYLTIKFKGASAFCNKLKNDKKLLERVKHECLTKKETNDDDETEDNGNYYSDVNGDTSDSLC